MPDKSFRGKPSERNQKREAAPHRFPDYSGWPPIHPFSAAPRPAGLSSDCRNRPRRSPYFSDANYPRFSDFPRFGKSLSTRMPQFADCKNTICPHRALPHLRRRRFAIHLTDSPPPSFCARLPSSIWQCIPQSFLPDLFQTWWPRQAGCPAPARC